MRLLSVGAEGVVQLPSEWIAELGISDVIRAERIGATILLSPHQAHVTSWDEVSSSKLLAAGAIGMSDPPHSSHEDALF